MIVQPKIRGFICTTAHPLGCAANVREQIEYIQSQPKILNGPKNVLVVGASNGYGLASRIVAAFGCGAKTVGVSFEKESENYKRTATAGWYNSLAFDRESKEAGLFSKSINGDAFSNEIKAQTIAVIKENLGPIDLLVYSLASPRRVDPKTNILYKSTLKPIGAPYTNKSIDFETDKIISVTLPPASVEEVSHTVAVMGGEDWELWIDALEKEGLLAPNVTTVAYSYVGPAVTQAVYRSGTIGAAKDHLEATAKKLDARLKAKGGRAFISVNKALVTQSSSAIPFIPLYFTILMKVLIQKGLHEECIHQMTRLFGQRLYTGKPVAVDSDGRIRVDDWEMRDDVQKEVSAIWEKVTNENVKELADVSGYHRDFLKLFGFGLKNVDYSADVKI
ncbi:MAG: trans-2-enoyl-CoA reductase family protein [Candidatus Omnitrophica bacterium]|nr:trans-2-enoyl-CoA reductase family protein [Candidatus Omnitrophota bacterium]